MQALVEDALAVELPPPIADGDLEERVRQAMAASNTAIVVLDDDPTGVQTVHDAAVLARWDVDALSRELRRSARLFFLLTNSRS